MWVRGLKQGKGGLAMCFCVSHPMWVRGLKLLVSIMMKCALIVAPYVGAWIETKDIKNARRRKSRTLCGCVD